MAINCKVFSHSETKFKFGWHEGWEGKKTESIALVLYSRSKCFKLFKILGDHS